MQQPSAVCPGRCSIFTWSIGAPLARVGVVFWPVNSTIPRISLQPPETFQGSSRFFRPHTLALLLLYYSSGRHLQHNREPYAAAERRVRHALVVSTRYHTFCIPRHWHLVFVPHNTDS
ncbi:unnamed protein product [Danaus chrysippus]|uniref:(African queen) hypothetical protein n=1 Tax=Danaus chrysippus TaxID=151541 RepID=A0A8J2VWQ1_9NEOP|nr:unnamed protein product [Danaus chrysippus]